MTLRLALVLATTFVVVAIVGACGILGLYVSCERDENCPQGICVDGSCHPGQPAGEGEEGEGEAAEGEGAEGEGAEGEGAEGEGAEGEGAEGEGAEGEGAEGEGVLSGEGEGGAEGEGEGGPPPNACNGTVFVPATIQPDLIVSAQADDAAAGCFHTITSALTVVLQNEAIFVARGTYSAAETFPLVVDVDGVTLVGDSDPSSAIIIGTAVPVVRFDGADDGVSGLTFRRTAASVGGNALIEGLGDDYTINNVLFDTGDSAIGNSGVRGTIIDVDTKGEIFLNTGAGNTELDRVTLRGTALLVGGVGDFTINNLTAQVTLNDSVRLSTLGQVHINAAVVTLFAGQTDCFAGIKADQGHVVIRNTQIGSPANPLPCPAIDAVDNNALDLDLGTVGAGDAGGNAFFGTPSGLHADFTNAGSNHVVNAVGNAWAHDPPVCGTDIAITPSSGVTVFYGPNAAVDFCDAP